MPPPRRLCHRRREGDDGLPPPRPLGDPHRRSGVAGGGEGEAELLASCYRRSLEVADELGALTVAFPAISTGVYGYPRDAAAEIAVGTLRAASTSAVEEVVLVAFDEPTRCALRGAALQRP